MIAAYLACLDQKPTSYQGEWVQARCPLAPWRHEKGTDHTPSFGIRIQPAKGASQVYCFSCAFPGDQHDLLEELVALKAEGIDIAGAVQLIAQAEDDAPNFVSPLKMRALAEDAGEDEELIYPEFYLNSFPQAFDHPYLATRQGGKIPASVAQLLDLRFDHKEQRILFPIRDHQGRLRGIHGRTVIGAELTYRMYNWAGGNNPHIWHGEDTVDIDRPVVFVESVFDRARVMQVYRNVVDPLTASVSVEKIERMGAVRTVIDLMDRDKAGKRTSEKMRKVLRAAKFHYPELPEGIKDPGEAGAAVIAELLEPLVDLDTFLLD
jgi:hypothetical protein